MLLLAARQRTMGLGFATAGLCLVLAVNLIDLIPNSGLTPLTWLIAGSVLGYWERGGMFNPNRDAKTALTLPDRDPKGHKLSSPLRPRHRSSDARSPMAGRRSVVGRQN